MLEKMTFNHPVLTFPKIRKHLQSKLTDGSFLMHTQGLTNEGHARHVPWTPFLGKFHRNDYNDAKFKKMYSC